MLFFISKNKFGRKLGHGLKHDPLWAKLYFYPLELGLKNSHRSGPILTM
jgi:hypothetical protein